MHALTGSGWTIAVFAAVAVMLLVVGVFRLDEVLARKKRRRKGPQLVTGRRLQQPGGRLADPHGGGRMRPPVSIRQGAARRRPRVIP